MPTRRAFLAAAGAFAAAAAAPAAERKFTIAFTPGSIGVEADQQRAIELAARYGYESVQPFAGDLAALSGGELDALRADMRSKNLVWAAAGLPVDFRGDEATFREGMRELPAAAATYQRAGVTRMGTWLMPRHDELTYLEYFHQTAERIREMATVLDDHGLRLGLEYVGTPSLRIAGKYQFVHSMAETKELIAEAGKTNVGFVLDTWHWWTAGETKADILTLRNEDIVSADLNDAPRGLEMLEQQDGSRELPLATGVIPVRDFLEALVEIGYDGPIRPEPFNQTLREMDDEAASETAAGAMKKAFALVA